MKTDISILFEEPVLDTEVELVIEPLAPFSIVSTLPGSFYKSLDGPTNVNLCGIFENILGWHIGPKERKKILKHVKSVHKKKFKTAEISVVESRVGYQSILGHLFKEILRVVPSIDCRYDDLWKQQLFRSGYSHPKGTPNLSYQLIALKNRLDKDANGVVTNEEIDRFHKDHKSNFPMYYTAPRKREFIVVDSVYKIKALMNKGLRNALSLALEDRNISYLGVSEGWADIRLMEI